MINSTLLLSEMLKKGFTQKDIAKKLNISTATLNYKINNKRRFYCDEALAICALLHLNSYQMNTIFFASELDYKSNTGVGYGV